MVPASPIYLRFQVTIVLDAGVYRETLACHQALLSQWERNISCTNFFKMAIGQKLFSKNPITGSFCRSLDISLVVSCGYLYTAKFSEQPFAETYDGLLLESY